MKKYFLISGLIHGMVFMWLEFKIEIKKKVDIVPVTLDVYQIEVEKTKETISQEVKIEKFVEQEKMKMNEISENRSRLISSVTQTVEKQTIVKNRGTFDNDRKKTSKKINHLDDSGQESPFKTKVIERAHTERGSQSFDYIEDLDSGTETLLNTRETVFYDYYSNLRKKINLTWNPIVKNKLQSVINNKLKYASAKDQVTRCLVKLDKSGRLIKIQIIGKSILPELDEAAVEAFRKASPFQKPPEDMTDSNGQIFIRWDFIIDS